jgi:hypothetical protein
MTLRELLRIIWDDLRGPCRGIWWEEYAADCWDERDTMYADFPPSVTYIQFRALVREAYSMVG